MKPVAGMKPPGDGAADDGLGIGGGIIGVGGVYWNGGSLASSSDGLDALPWLGRESVGSGRATPSSSSSMFLSCAIAPSMRDASPP